MNSELGRKLEVSTMASKPGVPKSGAISKGYNFASHWEQVLFLLVLHLHLHLPSFSNWPKFKFFMSVHAHLSFVQFVCYNYNYQALYQIRSD